MRSRPHELLDLEESELQTITDKRVQDAFLDKKIALQHEREAALRRKSAMVVMDEIEEKGRKLELAFEALKNELNRRQYLDQLRRDNANPMVSITSINDKTKELLFKVDKENCKKLLDEFEHFVKTEYKHLPENKYTAKKVRFASLEEFKDSNYFKNLSEEKKRRITKDNYPKSMHVLHFDNWNDALKFVREMTQKGILKPGSDTKLENHLIAKGLLKPDNESEKHYHSPTPFNTKCRPPGTK